MDSRVITQQLHALQERLALRGSLQNMTNRIHAAQNIKQILVDLKDGILSLCNAYAMTIYVADHVKKEIYSIMLAGTKLIEILLPIDNASIAGYAANNRKAISIADAYDREELQRLDKELTFDDRWDKKSGFKTVQVMAVPILYDQSVMGAVEIINRKGGGKFSAEEQSFLEEIADVLGIAFYNQQRVLRRRKTRFDYLVARGLISEPDLDNSWPEARRANETMEEYLIRKFRMTKSDIGKSLEDFYRCKFIQFDDRLAVPEDLLKNLRQEYLHRELWLPLERIEGGIRVLVDDPNNILKKDTIESLLKTKAIEYCVALKEDILKYINQFYRARESAESITDMIERFTSAEEKEAEEEVLVLESDSVIAQLVDKIISDANARQASDIHIEPNVRKKTVDVRFRIDGDCVHYLSMPYSYRTAAVSWLKIMSNLDITEHRLPQDGKIKRKTGGEEIELRVATIPTQGSVEDVVLRILAKGETMRLEQLSMSPRNYAEFAKILAKPYGLILVVGPTGSGKTTTLHAALRHINTPDMKIWTAEDPVEITQEGLRQVQVNPRIGLDFSHAMRAFLRADPDVIMVGEMRDFETAKTGIEASLTGHLVFSTLHTNNASETIVRLLDMGLDPFNFADSLLGILGQRLVRTLCQRCKEAYHPAQEEYDEIIHHYGENLSADLHIRFTEAFRLYRPRGCSACNQTGYRGRMGLHEILVASDQIRRLVTRREPVELLRDTAVSEGMRTLLQDGVWKVVSGLTDFKQVLSVCIR